MFTLNYPLKYNNILSTNMEISATTKILGVIGDPISHSMIPTIHNAAIQKLGMDYVSVAFNIKRENLSAACEGFRAMGISGINVTIPHKIEVMRYLDEIKNLPTLFSLYGLIIIKNDLDHLPW